MNKTIISIKSKDASIELTLVPGGEVVTMRQILVELIIPALLAAEFDPVTIDKYFSELR